MHLLHTTLAGLAALAIHASAQDVDYNDLPSQCQSACAPVVSLTQQCDQQYNDDDDAGQLQCVCSAQNATMVIPLCEACYAMYDSDGHDNDVHDIVTKCSFTTTTYSASAMTGDVVSTGETMVTTPATGTSAGSVVVATPTDTSSPSQFSGAAAHGAELGGRLGQALGLWGIIGALMA